MRTVATLGSCLSGLTGVMLAGDYRWVRLNNAVVDRSDLFVKYFLRRERMPSREIVEMLLEVKPEHAEWTKQLFQRMFRETAGLADLPPETTPLFDNLESKRFDLFVLDNQHDTHNIKCTYRSLDGRLDFEFNFPLHWCERHDLMQDSFHWSPCLEPAEFGAVLGGDRALFARRAAGRAYRVSLRVVIDDRARPGALRPRRRLPGRAARRAGRRRHRDRPAVARAARTVETA